MRSLRSLVLSALVLVACVAPSFGQEVTVKKDIAVFALSTYDATVPAAVMGSVDAAIQGVFINLGRFNVLGMTYRLGKGDVDAFVAKIKDFKQNNVQIPEKVQMGKEFFTEADLNKIIGAFIVVIPSVTFFAVENNASTSSSSSSKASSATSAVKSALGGSTAPKDTKGSYHAKLQSSFTFVDIEKMTAFAQVNLETDGYDDNSDMAAKEAVDDIPTQLTYEIRKIETFKLKTGVVEVQGRTIIIELGRGMGVQLGDEYEIVGSRVLASGKTLSTRTGLVVIREVSDEVSIAQIIYAAPKPQVGDQLKEFPLLGATVLPYAQIMLGSVMGSENVFLPGVRAVWNRGLFRFKPQVGVQVPIGVPGLGLSGGWLPVDLYVGGEMDLYLGRLQINPMVNVGLGGAIPISSSNQDFALSHFGFSAAVNATFLLADKLKLSLDGGFAYWIDLEGLNRDYYGPLAGVGVEFKL
jgi:hypothetical protein